MRNFRNFHDYENRNWPIKRLEAKRLNSEEVAKVEFIDVHAQVHMLMEASGSADVSHPRVY